MLWTDLVAEERRLILRAPRSHGKTTLLLAYIAWCCWRHGRDASGRLIDGAPGPFDIMLFSATREQVSEHMVRLRDLLEANSRLFATLLPEAGVGTGSGRAGRRPGFACAMVRRSGPGPSTRACAACTLTCSSSTTSSTMPTRGTLEQRRKTLNIFMRTILPMAPKKLVIIGTAIHQTDLLAHLGQGMGKQPDPLHTPLGFGSRRSAHSTRRPASRCGPNGSRPTSCTPSATPTPWLQPGIPERSARRRLIAVPVRADPARASTLARTSPSGPAIPPATAKSSCSAWTPRVRRAAGADFTVMIVVAYDVDTGTRRVLDIRREKGLEFDAQIELIRDLVARHRVDVADGRGERDAAVDRRRARGVPQTLRHISWT